MKLSLGRRALASALLISTLFVGSVAVAPEANAYTTHSEAVMAHLINGARHHYHIRGLRYSPSLSRLARQHSLAMANAGTIFHTSNLAYELRHSRWNVAGENVGMGPSMAALHRAFMNSPHHRENNLYRGYRYVGIGVVWKDGIAYITVQFIG